MKAMYQKIKSFVQDKDFLYQLFAGALVLLFGMVTSVLGNHHATNNMGASVPDIFI